MVFLDSRIITFHFRKLLNKIGNLIQFMKGHIVDVNCGHDYTILRVYPQYINVLQVFS